MKRLKRTFTTDERNLVFDLWKDGAGFSDSGRVIEAKPGSIFTILRVTLSAKKSIRAIASMLNRSPSTISREVARNRGRRYYKAIDADNRAKRMAKRPKLGMFQRYPELKQIVIDKLELKRLPEQISGWLSVEYSRRKKMQVSHETIYKSLYVRSKNILEHSLSEHLRRKRPVRHPKLTRFCSKLTSNTQDRPKKG
jgi:IS30 family transposase